MARKTQKVEQTRPKNFLDDPKAAKEGGPGESDAALSKEELERQKKLEEAQQRMDARPEVSTMVVDEETGIEVVAQGQNVMDVITRKAVQLSPLGPEYRLAQMFPGPPPDIREKYRFDWNTVTVPQMVQQLQEAASVTLPDGTRRIPPHPSVSNRALDFVLANRDYLGFKMKRALGRIQMKTQATMDKEAALEMLALWKNFLTIENHLSAPFRQIIMDAEGRVGPNFGNLDLMSFCDGDLYERAANYLVLKGMVAHWEKKVIDADYVEKTPQTEDNWMKILGRGDPKRYLPDPPILYTLSECTQVCAMSQQMTKAFVETPELFDDLPVEVRFLEIALTIKGGTALRKFIADEFCPAEGITPEALREGLRRLHAQLENMQIDPYADITNILEKLLVAMTIGTKDERDPYLEYLVNKNPDGPGNFPTYTFNHEKLSLVRFFDSQYPSVGAADLSTITEAPDLGELGEMFNNIGGTSPTTALRKPAPASTDNDKVYKVPVERAAERPHELGWLDLLDDELNHEDMQLGKIAPGKIIVED